jgi:RNA polymerase sigma factor (sigma-70 family)
VATNRWIDVKRRDVRRVELPQGDAASGGRELAEEGREASGAFKEETLITLLRQSLEVAFAKCSPKAIVLLRLVYMHGLTQREIGRMLGWGESKVSRFLSEAMGGIEKRTMRELKKLDPLLELNWQDFVDLCETHRIGFL